MNKECYTSVSLNNFKKGQKLYMVKGSQYPVYFFCEFVSFEKGMVRGKIIDIQDKSAIGRPWNIGDEIAARPSWCYVYGISEKENTPEGNRRVNERCHWFQKVGSQYVAK